MADDLALWGFILGAVGTVLSSILAAFQIASIFRAKSGERIEKVRALFQEILGPLHSLDHEFNRDTIYRVVPSLQEKRDRILGLGPLIVKAAPEISKDLSYLVGLIGMRNELLDTAFVITRDSNNKTLISRLHKNIEKWLSEHA